MRCIENSQQVAVSDDSDGSFHPMLALDEGISWPPGLLLESKTPASSSKARDMDLDTKHEESPSRTALRDVARSLKRNELTQASSSAIKRSRRSAESVRDHHYFSDGFEELQGPRLRELNFVLKSLTVKQKQDVESIGFGGLLHYDVTDIPHQMTEWLLNSFMPFSRYFYVDGCPKFMISPSDVSDIFGFSSRADVDVEDDATDPQVLGILEDWKENYDVPGGDTIRLKELSILVKILEQGGVDFKRCFVLFVLFSLLTPAPRKSTRIGLLKSLVDVEGIKSRNWSSFIFDHLCTAVERYHRNTLESEFEGCILILLLTYFQNCYWNGKRDPIVRPLLILWPESRLRNRLDEELSAGGYGRGTFSSDLVASQMEKAFEMVSDTLEKITFYVDRHFLDDRDLALLFPNEVERRIAHLIRDLSVVMSTHVSKWTNLSQSLVYKLQQNMDFTNTSPGSMKQSLHEVIGALTFIANEICNYDHPCSDDNECMDSNDHLLGLSLKEVVGGTCVEAPESNLSGIDYVSWLHMPCKAGRIYLSKLLCKAAYMNNHAIPAYHVEIADYCLAIGPTFSFNEPLFYDGKDILIFRNNMICLDNNDDVSTMVMNAWSRLLNDEWMTGGPSGRLCLELVERGHMLHSDMNLVAQWTIWLRQANLTTTAANMLFIPVRFRNKFNAILVDFINLKLICFDSVLDCEEKYFADAIKGIVGQFWKLLESLGDPRVGLQKDFKYVLVHPNWSEGRADGESGICIMSLMESFKGDLADIVKLNLHQAQTRVEFRVSSCARIVLSPLNKYRHAVLGRIPSYVRQKSTGRLSQSIHAEKMESICKIGFWESCDPF